MSICITPGQNFEVALVRGRVLGFDRLGSVVVRCLEGTVWITAPTSEDIVLDPRERATLNGQGRIVVQALDSARFQIEEMRERIAS